jgi:hypothetical protein
MEEVVVGARFERVLVTGEEADAALSGVRAGLFDGWL